jgi:hypothetical protein
MKGRNFIVGFTLIALAAGFILIYVFAASSATPRPVRLVITGPDGQVFSGNYVVDGVTNSIKATTPATISFQAGNVDYEFKREGGNGEFRVATYAGNLGRTSTTSGSNQGIRGALHNKRDKESYWATPF